ncbi:hypothetical protein [Enterococcus bulliens]
MQERQNDVLIRGIFECLDIPAEIANETIENNTIYCYENGSWNPHKKEQEVIKATMELGLRPFLVIQQEQHTIVLYVDKLVENADAIKETQKEAHARVSQWLADAENEKYHVLVYTENHTQAIQKEVVIRKTAEGNYTVL